MEKDKIKISEENIAELQQCVKRLCGRVNYFEEGDFELEIGAEYVHIPLPGEDDEVSLLIDEFFEFDWQMANFKIIDNGRIHTTTLSFQIIKAETEDLEYYLKNATDFFQDIEGVSICIEEAPIYVAIACILLNSYHKDFGTGYEKYTVIRIEYEDKRERFEVAKEAGLIYSYLFEIADSTGFIFYLSKILHFDTVLMEKIEKLGTEAGDEGDEEPDEFLLKELLEYSSAMKLYVSALQTADQELRILNFYKIFEFFAPIVINIDSYELLSKKLDSPKVLKPDREYLASIFELTNTINQKMKDSELIKSVFNRCFDLVELFDDLPKSIQRKVLGILKEKRITYDIGKEKLSQAGNVIASTIYSTRNQVVHAKSNFQPTGDECPSDDLDQLNVFLQRASARIIRWHHKLPDHQKFLH